MWLEVLTAPAGAPLRVGERFTLRADPPLQVGPASDARVRLPLSYALELRLLADGAATMVVAGDARGLAVNGQARGRGTHELGPGDVVEVAPRHVLLVRGRLQPPARSPELEARLAEAPDEPAAWAVYQDFLSERGDPLGEWMVAARAVDAPGELPAAAQQLGPLAVAWASRPPRLIAEWNPWGFLSAARLTHDAAGGELLWLLEQLEQLPVARFLQRLQLDAFADELGPGDPRSFAGGVRRVLERAPWRASLRALVLGHASLPDSELRAFDELVALVPRVPPGSLVRAPSQAALVLEALPAEVSAVGLHVGERWPLVPRTLVGSAPRCRLRLVGPALWGTLCTVDRLPSGAWHVISPDLGPGIAPLLTVNGSVPGGALFHGDVIEPWPGVRLRFVRE